MKVTVKTRSRVLGYIPGQTVILEDTPKIRRLIESGHLELLHEDVKHASNKGPVKPKEHTKTTRPSGGNRTQTASDERVVRDSENSTSRGRDEEHIRSPWQTGELVSDDSTPDDQERETN